MSKSAALSTNILRQGHMDGFCLLYAVVNAFKAVYAPDSSAEDFAQKLPTSTIWPKLISATPSIHTFASYGSFLPDISEDGKENRLDVEIKELLLKQYAEILTEHLKGDGVVKIERIIKGEGNMPSWQKNLVGSTDWQDSAVILCLGKKNKLLEYPVESEHWIAVVGSLNNQLCVACSYTGLMDSSPREEKVIKIDKQPRSYNNSIIAKLEAKSVCVGYRYRLIIDQHQSRQDS